ncbi:hypothetical protein EDD80_10162 [Anseongella ginsenosidimutans]|uniref:Zinc ribbon protein n=1 Tax=Anseongella ginsenosidimutans TaxID=496056 RepID=A0A4R3KW88_9SPHI|nr:DUF6320 domain-containing protein [Anseongella ginsenosidimutans]QEC51429.1 hypothetical protein FRZ59_03055 [Anseongella ginsenosidimutans]TCS89865.1 hypothetical protein EDD80_10162 [Anseongella ginsenosidimutans]
MAICKNCGVELEEVMLSCPLCGEPVAGSGESGTSRQTTPAGEPAFQPRAEMSQPQKKFTWEIISIILLSGLIATFIVDFVINQTITWSEYPVAISLTIFAYISLFAFWQQPTLLQIAGSLALSIVFLLLLDLLTNGISWSVGLGIPLLLAANLVAAGLIGVIYRSKYKGINLLAWGFLGAAFLCLCIEGILVRFMTGTFRFGWSLIVCGSVIPVALVLFFVHLRLKKGRSLEKTFHM